MKPSFNIPPLKKLFHLVPFSWDNQVTRVAKVASTALTRVGLFLLLPFFLLFPGCKLNKNEIQPQTTFHVTFLDANKNQLRSVSVFLFDNQSAYAQSLLDLHGNGGTSYFSSDGTLTIAGLAQGTYWVQCYTTDSSGTTPLQLNNNLGGYTITNNYKEAQSVELEIILQPTGGLVVFYSPSLSTSGPIQITINNKLLQGTLTLASPNPPSPNAKDGSAYAISVPGNSFTYFAKGTGNCAWTDKVNLLSGKTTYVKLVPCQLGNVTFVGNSGTNVFIGENTIPAGMIGSTGQLVLELPANVTYTWFADQGSCAWSGSVLIENNPKVTLPTCN